MTQESSKTWLQIEAYEEVNNEMKFAVGGAIDKQKVAAKIKEASGGQAEAAVMSDVEAAMAVKTGKADYYVGACATGGGGALALAMAILGSAKCAILSMPGKPPKHEMIEKAVREGKVAFGITSDHIDTAVPMLVEVLMNKEGNQK